MEASDGEKYTPKLAKRIIISELKNKLKARIVHVGSHAVTAKINGREYQFVPILKANGKQYITSTDGKRFTEFNPKSFTNDLNIVDKRHNGSAKDAIAIVKRINRSIEGRHQLSSHDIECIAIEKFGQMKKGSSLQTLVRCLLGYVPFRVLNPIRDCTGQTRYVDDNLGGSFNGRRYNISKKYSEIKENIGECIDGNKWRRLESILK